MDTAVRGDLPVPESDFIARVAAGPWPAFKQGGALTRSAEMFLRGLHQDTSADELGQLSIEDLTELAHEFWKWSSERAPQEQAVRIRRGTGAGGQPIGRDVLEIAGPDMPFLVDSIMGELADQRIAPLAMFHPLAPAIKGEGRDSLIQIHTPPLSAVRSQGLHEGVRATLADVRRMVFDFLPLRRRMMDCADELSRARANAAPEDLAEAVALLRWLAADRFTFLGARDYIYARDKKGELMPVEPEIVGNSGLGLLRDPERYVLRTSAEPMLLTPELRRLIEEPTPLIVAKSTLRSRVHRRAPADYVGVKRYGIEGEVVGETRFIGLFTSEGFLEPTRDIPVLRRKIDWVMRACGFAGGGHSAKAMRHVLETYPRDELWQIEREDLLHIARGIVHLVDRPRPRVFARRDRFNRFITALTYLPKDRFNSRLRQQAGHLLEDAYGGGVEGFYPEFVDGPLARVYFVVGDIDKTRPAPDEEALDEKLEALTRTWEDDFTEALSRSDLFDSGAREAAAARLENAFTIPYRERFSVDEALIDCSEILRRPAGGKANWALRVRAFRNPGDRPDLLRCKFYVKGEVLALSATVPILENLGLYVESEQNYELTLDARGDNAAERVHVHDIEMRVADGVAVDLEGAGAQFEDAFIAIWTGLAENDGFNKLVLKLGVTWRDAALIRAMARFRQQSGLDPSPAVQERAVAAHTDIAALILGLFRVRFDPDLPDAEDSRSDWARQIEDRIEHALGEVESLDEDRALRRMACLVGAIVRTNYYQKTADGGVKPYMSFKIDSGALKDLPAPKPYREIWVASPDVEGVHLRMGPVARGGLRWSDRRDDFRSEVLELVKAQYVKNAIIVPVGAKGGFFPKRLPGRDDPHYRDAAVAAYRTFLRGLLDITDNIDGERVIAPERVVRWDGDDPYLVVAADKGTASFSDIANAISGEYGFWLGDAFASGGSAGYDHKAMGITAKGAWVAVQRHFRELGKDIQEEPFNVIGVGDMSGDVFGNGMLLSKQIRLLAAFDHRHIFLDPNPGDLNAHWAERKRVFEMGRSSWDDYKRALISKGGGVYSRALKAIDMTPEVAALTGIDAPKATPAEIISALLKAPCELLWFGGIGNFIKARSESHLEVGDKANDAVRVDAEDLRALVIGEGANLGVTQKGRIAFARTKKQDGGGRINTDAVDNSAGVDTSDHEVNIKILLGDASRSGSLKDEDRNALLESMTEDVAALVLKDNYDQTLALSLSEASAVTDLDSHERFMVRLENAGKLSRVVEGLPNTEEVAVLRAARQGLTRPELAKLVAHAKIDLFDALTASDLPDDPAFAETLQRYFPNALERFEAERGRHRLRREIIATSLADDIVNRCGPSFVDRIRDIARVEPVETVRAFEIIRRVLRLGEFSAKVNGLDNKAPAGAQVALLNEANGAVRRIAIYLARRSRLKGRPALSIGDLAGRYAGAVDAQRETMWSDIGVDERAWVEARAQALMHAGAPEALAQEAALYGPMSSTFEIADLALEANWRVGAAARMFRALGAALGLDALRAGAAVLNLEQHWDRLVLRRTLAELLEDQGDLARAAAGEIVQPSEASSADWAARAVGAWIESLGAAGAALRGAIAELEGQGGWSFAKVMLAAAEVRALAEALRPRGG